MRENLRVSSFRICALDSSHSSFFREDQLARIRFAPVELAFKALSSVNHGLPRTSRDVLSVRLLDVLIPSELLLKEAVLLCGNNTLSIPSAFNTAHANNKNVWWFLFKLGGQLQRKTR